MKAVMMMTQAAQYSRGLVRKALAQSRTDFFVPAFIVIMY